jgi:hypothetical protein
MTEQPESLRLADELEDCRIVLPLERKAAAELRRLHEVNAELLGTLVAIEIALQLPFATPAQIREIIRAAIAKAEGWT